MGDKESTSTRKMRGDRDSSENDEKAAENGKRTKRRKRTVSQRRSTCKSGRAKRAGQGKTDAKKWRETARRGVGGRSR